MRFLDRGGPAAVGTEHLVCNVRSADPLSEWLGLGLGLELGLVLGLVLGLGLALASWIPWKIPDIFGFNFAPAACLQSYPNL